MEKVWCARCHMFGDFLIAQAFQKLSEIETGWHQTILLNSLSLSMKKIIVDKCLMLAWI